MSAISILLVLVGFAAIGIGVFSILRSKDISARIAASRDRRGIIPLGSDRRSITLVAVCGALLTVAGIVLALSRLA
jgi:hypothetical protein